MKTGRKRLGLWASSAIMSLSLSVSAFAIESPKEGFVNSLKEGFTAFDQSNPTSNKIVISFDLSKETCKEEAEDGSMDNCKLSDEFKKYAKYLKRTDDNSYLLSYSDNYIFENGNYAVDFEGLTDRSLGDAKYSIIMNEENKTTTSLKFGCFSDVDELLGKVDCGKGNLTIAGQLKNKLLLQQNFEGQLLDAADYIEQIAIKEGDISANKVKEELNSFKNKINGEIEDLSDVTAVASSKSEEAIKIGNAAKKVSTDNAETLKTLKSNVTTFGESVTSLGNNVSIVKLDAKTAKELATEAKTASDDAVLNVNALETKTNNTLKTVDALGKKVDELEDSINQGNTVDNCFDPGYRIVKRKGVESCERDKASAIAWASVRPKDKYGVFLHRSHNISKIEPNDFEGKYTEGRHRVFFKKPMTGPYRVHIEPMRSSENLTVNRNGGPVNMQPGYFDVIILYDNKPNGGNWFTIDVFVDE